MYYYYCNIFISHSSIYHSTSNRQFYNSDYWRWYYILLYRFPFNYCYYFILLNRLLWRNWSHLWNHLAIHNGQHKCHYQLLWWHWYGFTIYLATYPLYISQTALLKHIYKCTATVLLEYVNHLLLPNSCQM